jgi:hypothetical protein
MMRLALGFVLGLGCSAGIAWAQSIYMANTRVPNGIGPGQTLYMICAEANGFNSRPMVPTLGTTPTGYGIAATATCPR